VKLLFDENLSPKLVRLLATEFPDSSHIEALGMRGATERAVWEYTGDHGFTI
jgi:predicted nuclease of predicted toxin-antitoxin system